MKFNSKLCLRLNSGSLFALYIALVLVVYILPAFKITVPYVFAALLMLVFLPVSMIKMQNKLNFHIVLLVATLVSVVFYFVNDIYGPIDSINEAIRYIRFFMPVVWTLYALRFCSPKQRRVMLFFFGVVITFVLIKTIMALENDVWIARILAQDKSIDTPEIRSYRMGNIGGFEFAYMMGVVELCLTWAAFQCKNSLARNMNIIGAIIGFYYIIQTMYMTLLILTSMGIFLLSYLNTKSIDLKVFLVIGSVITLFSLAPLSLLLSEVFSGSLLSLKFSQFYDALMGGGTDSLGARPEFIMDAVMRWLKSPIWGGYDTSVFTHSFVFSTLEAIGLIGLFAFLGCLCMAYKLISLELKKQRYDINLISIIFLYILALSILNPIGYVFEVTIAGFFIAPLWSAMISSQKKYVVLN